MINKDKNRIFEELLQNVFQKIPQVSYVKTGGVFRTLLEIIALFFAKIYQELSILTPNLFIHSATGNWLDEHAHQFGLHRFSAKKTRGYITFRRTNASNDLTISKDKIVSNHSQTLRYRVLEETIIPKDTLSMDILVESEKTGTRYNVLENEISRLITHINGIESISNKSDWIIQMGQDIETDSILQERCINLWKGLSGSNKNAYESWAKSVSGIDKVVVFSPPDKLGVVEVIVLGSNNTVVSEEILEKLNQVMEDNRPIGTEVIIKNPIFVPIDLDITVKYHSSDFDNEFVMQKIREFFMKLNINQDIEISALSAKIFEYNEIQAVSIDVKSPINPVDPNHILISKYQIASIGTISIIEGQ